VNREQKKEWAKQAVEKLGEAWKWPKERREESFSPLARELEEWERAFLEKAKERTNEVD
jgi:hypothetical protein